MISVTGSSGSRGLKLVWEKGKPVLQILQYRFLALLMSLQRILTPFNMLKNRTFK